MAVVTQRQRVRMMFQFPGFQHRLHLDAETFSECDIKRAGARKYASDPSTEALMLGWAVDDGPVQQWLPHEGAMPLELRAMLDDPTVARQRRVHRPLLYEGLRHGSTRAQGRELLAAVRP